MALDGTPWFIGGGAHHSPEVARLLAYAATSGAQGVVEPSSLAVVPASVPNNTVVVLPGAALVLNRYAGSGGGQQTYVVRNPESTPVTIQATGSTGGRTDAVVARVLDPQYEGSVPSDPVNFQYSRVEVIRGVPANLTRIGSLGLSYPAVLLAKVTIPASTATITKSMITDLREVAIPRTKELVFPRPAVVGSSGLVLNSRDAHPVGEWFPNFGGQENNGAYYVDVPEWATRMQIRMEWLAVRYNPNAGYGYCWVTYGPGSGSANPPYSTQAFQWDASQSNQTQRQNWVVHDERYVPPEMRGTRTAFVGRANKTSPNTSSYNGTVELTPTSGMVFSVKFMEQADNEIA